MLKMHLGICLCVSGLLLPFQATPVSATIPTGGLVGYWTAEGNADDNIQDGNHGTLQNGATFATGQAFSFDGTDDFVQIWDDPSLNPGQISVAAWAYVTGKHGQHRAIVSKDDDDNRQYLLTASDANRFRAHVGVPSGFEHFDGATTVQLYKWYHVAMTYDGSSLNLYVNGVLDGSKAVTGAILPTPEVVRIGARLGVNQLHFQGLLDQVALYNYALSESEIQALATPVPDPSNLPESSPGLVSWWTAEGNVDDIQGVNHGTLQKTSQSSGSNWSYGATFATGQVGQAFSFDGTDDFVQIQDDASLNPGQISVMAWAYVTGKQRQDRAIVSKDNGDNRQYLLSASRANRFRAHLGVQSGFEHFDGATTVQSYKWYHVAMTYDGSSLNLYVNGVLDGSMPVTGAILPTPEVVRIGARLGVNQLHFKGLLDEVALYNYALSESEIQALATPVPDPSNLPESSPGLVSWWTAEGNADDIQDVNHGTLQNGATFATGQAFSFDGTDDFVQIQDDPSLNPGQISVAAWAYVTGKQGQDRAIVGKDNDDNRQYLLTASRANRFRPHVGVQSGFEYFDGAKNTVQSYKWYHVAMTYDGSSLNLYVNGMEDGSMPVTGAIRRTPEVVRIGARLGVNQLHFQGLLDEVALYNYALNPSEIKVLANPTFVWDGGGDGSRWSDARNWGDDVMPVGYGFIVIRGANVLLDVDLRLRGYLTIVQGTLTLLGKELVNEGLIQITDGTLAVEDGGKLWSYNDSEVEISNGSTLTNNGTVELTNPVGVPVNGGTLLIRLDCTFNNSGTFIQSGGTFINNGTYNEWSE